MDDIDNDSKERLKKSLERAKKLSQTVDKFSVLATLAVFVGGIAASLFSYLKKPYFEGTDFTFFTSVIALLVAIVGTVMYFSAITGQKQTNILTEISEIEVNDLQKTIEDDFFTNLVKINFKYIDKYYLQTQLQANKSFMLSVVASSVAFMIIIAGIVLMFQGQTNSSLVATGAGVLSEFIAAVFFYLYNKTIAKMGEYHHKLVLTQNISLALKITEQMEGELKSKAQLQLIEQLTKDINLHIASKPSE
jgi:hypothetical protein